MKDVKDDGNDIQSLSYEEFLLAETKNSEKVKKKRKRQSEEKLVQKRAKSDKIIEISDEKSSEEKSIKQRKNSNVKLKTQRLEDVFFKKARNEETKQKSADKKSNVLVKKLSAKRKHHGTPTKNKEGIINLISPTTNLKQSKFSEKRPGAVSRQIKAQKSVKDKRRKSSDDCLVFVGEVKKNDKDTQSVSVSAKSKLSHGKKITDSNSRLISNSVVSTCTLPPLENEAILWSEKYEPKCTNDIVVGNIAGIQHLKDWLREWKKRWEKEIQEERAVSTKKGSDSDSDFELENEDKAIMKQDDTFAKAAAIIGPTGCGKTASVYACANEFQFKVLEMNASSQRSNKQIVSQLHEATQSHQVAKSNHVSNFFKVVNKQEKIDRNSLILFEDVEILFESDKFFWSGVENLISETKRPIILTTSDRRVLSNLEVKCEKFILGPAKIDRQCEILNNIAKKENCIVSGIDIKMMIRMLGCDIRKSVHALHFWGGESSQSSVKTAEADVINLIDSGSTSKDENGQSSDAKTLKTKRRSKRRSRNRNSLEENNMKNLLDDKQITPKLSMRLDNLSSKVCGIYNLISEVKVERSLIPTVTTQDQLVSKVQVERPSSLGSSTADHIVAKGKGECLPVSMATASDQFSSSFKAENESVFVGTSKDLLSKVKVQDATSVIASSDIHKFCKMLVKNSYKTEEVMSQWLSSNFPHIIQLNWLSLLLPCGSTQHAVGKSMLNIHVPRSYLAKTSDMEFYGLSVDDDFLASVVQEESNDFLIEEDSVDVSYPAQTSSNSFYPTPIYYQPAITGQNSSQPVYTGYNASTAPTQFGIYQHPPTQPNLNPFQLVQLGSYTQPPARDVFLPQQPVHSGFNFGNSNSIQASSNPFQLVQIGSYMHPAQAGLFCQPLQSGASSATSYNQYPHVQNTARLPTNFNSFYPVSTGFYPTQTVSGSVQNSPTGVNTVRHFPSNFDQADVNRRASQSHELSVHAMETGSFRPQPRNTVLNLSKPDETSSDRLKVTSSGHGKLETRNSLFDLFKPVKTSLDQSKKTLDDPSSTAGPRRQTKAQNSVKDHSVLEVLSSMADACCVFDCMSATLSKVRKNSQSLRENLDSTNCKMSDGLLDVSSDFDLSHHSIVIANDIQASLQVRSIANCHEKIKNLWINSDDKKVSQELNVTDNKVQNELFSKEIDISLRLPYEGKSLRNNQYLRRSLQSQVRGAISATSRAFVADYLPAMRSICRSEDVRKVSKRRFLHYFDTIHIYPNSVEMNKLKNEFKEVVFEQK